MTVKKQIKLLFVSADKYPPFRVDVIVLFGKELVNRGFKIDWLLQSDEDCSIAYTTELSGGKVWVGSTNNETSRFARIIKHVKSVIHDLKIFSLVKQNNYDVIQVKDKFIAALFAAGAVRRSPTKFIYWLSWPFPETDLYAIQMGMARYPIIYWMRGKITSFLLYRIILKSAFHVFVQSDEMKRHLESKGVAAEKMTPVPMGVDLDDFPVVSEDDLNYRHESPAKILYLGALTKDRKLDFLVRVFKKVFEGYPDSELVFVGGGEADDIAILSDEIARCGLVDNVTITGFMEREKALEQVKKASVCVAPLIPSPIFDMATPTKLVEYMMMGRAVVANDHPDQKMVVEASGGGICVDFEEDAFVQAIVELLENPGKADLMGKLGCEYVRIHRSYEKIASDLEKKYRRLVIS